MNMSETALKIAYAYKANQSLPEDVIQKLQTLAQNANFITSVYAGGNNAVVVSMSRQGAVIYERSRVYDIEPPLP